MKPLSVTAKVVILLVFAVLFGATMIALSGRDRQEITYDGQSWGSDKQIDRTFDVQPGGTVVVDADVGSVVISGDDSQHVVVHAMARGSEENLSRMRVDFDQTGNQVNITQRVNRRMFHIFNTNNLDVRFEIRVPRNFNCRLKTSGGDIDVRALTGTVRGETSGGDLDIHQVEGRVDCSTSGGNIEVVDLSGDCAMETSGGNIRAEAVTGTIHLGTSGGNIDIRDSDGKLDASTSGGDIRASMKTNKGIDLSTSGGSLTVRIPADAAGSVEAETSGGEVGCELPFDGKIKDGRMHGSINGGGSLIRLETSGGDIIISPLQ